MTSYRIGRYDYSSHFLDVDDGLMPEIRSLLLEGGYILGSPVSEFESGLAAYVGARHAVGVNSGTDALILALAALGIQRGDEVITVANTFHATPLAIERVGARPVLVDCRSDDYLIDLEQVEAAMTTRTKAVIVVHLFGRSVDMPAVCELAASRSVAVIEDAAQAIGATSRGSRVGALSSAGCFSFAPSKNLAAAGDAGAITLNDQAVAEKLRLLRHFGQAEQDEHQLTGYNSRLDTIQALVLLHKLPQLDGWTRRRVAVAKAYEEQLTDLPVAFQDPGQEGEHVYHLFQVSTSERDGLLARLRAHGVDAVVRYRHPIHLQQAFAHFGYRPGAFPVAERLAATTLCLPLHHAMSESTVEEICDVVRTYLGASHKAGRLSRASSPVRLPDAPGAG